LLRRISGDLVKLGVKRSSRKEKREEQRGGVTFKHSPRKVEQRGTGERRRNVDTSKGT